MQICWLVTFISLLGNHVVGYYYCGREREFKLCRSYLKRHIVCDKEQIIPRADYIKHYPMTNYFREWLRYWHNYYRNDLACGNVPGLDGMMPPATKMRELIWDYELEYIASVHASRCNMTHDKCRNTDRFFQSGQNLAYHRTVRGPKPPLFRGWKSVNSWFNESIDTPIDTIPSYRKSDNDKKIGHFTVVANDRIGRLGCGMTYCTGRENGYLWHYNFLACNYDDTNVPTYAVYQAGNPQSNCDYFNAGKSSNFSCLCDRTP